MKHYTKKVDPERSRLIQGLVSQNAAMYKFYRYGANAARGWRGYGAGADKLTI